QPDPVLQQIEDFADGTVSVNDCFRPVSRYFDRITRPEQIMDALPRAMAVMHDPASCGPATLGFCQDVQAEAFDYPETFFARRLWRVRRPGADADEQDALVAALKTARHPLLIAGGGVLYSGAEGVLDALTRATGLAVAETQAGKGALAWNHPCNLGAIGVTGSSAANAAAARADLVVGVGTRLADFTTGSRSLFPTARKFQVNILPFDACKHGALPVTGDARTVLEALGTALAGWRAPAINANEVAVWTAAVDAATAAPTAPTRPSDAQVIGAVQRSVGEDAIVVCAAGGLPGELHKLWRTARSGGYHVEYGYSCMGYEIAGGVGVKMAAPDREIVVMVGDGSYLMLNSELATSVLLGQKLIVVVLDNGGFGCIHRLQHATGGAAFNNLLADARHVTLPAIDFAAHAASLGALSEHVADIAGLEAALARARAAPRSYVVVIDTDPRQTTDAGGWWWNVAVPEVSARPEVDAARRAYERGIQHKKNLS
ncbi:MAG: 3D-(3,5/4)-trihydroxycyclohexane-1,2-dione acylhydrolase (decyclizing), partial [Xanthomonadales bacterium]|nr:3D-(3,5/4)-trihydroxycyclohexane-1,2-dione acylhydrolase (decyclizing) [Xanthomonadales bacterium]